MSKRFIPLVAYKNGVRIIVGQCTVDVLSGAALIQEIVIDPSVPMNQYVMNQLDDRRVA